MKIMLDPGHGPGRAHNRGSKIGNEGDNNFKMYEILRRELEALGFFVGTTRPTINHNPGLAARGKAGKGYDLFLSLHTNAGGGTGVEIFDDTNPKHSNKKLADMLCRTISETLGIRNRGTKYRRTARGSNYYGVLRNNLAKNGMIIEFCFHDNYQEIKHYLDNIELVAKNVARTLADYYGMTKPIENQNKEDKKMDNKKDYEDSWAKENIERVMDLGLMTGYEDGSFKPQNQITRAEIATVLCRLIDKAGLDIKK